LKYLVYTVFVKMYVGSSFAVVVCVIKLEQNSVSQLNLVIPLKVRTSSEVLSYRHTYMQKITLHMHEMIYLEALVFQETELFEIRKRNLSHHL
jgi:hypothetical protein